MKISFLRETALFQGWTVEDIGRLLGLLGCTLRSWTRGNTILAAGTPANALGVVCAGSVRVESDDFWGNRSVLGVFEAGELFAEAYACVPEEPLMVNVVANTDCQVLFIRTEKLFSAMEESELRRRFLCGLTRVCARKNLELSRHMLHTAPKTIRGRLMSYLSWQVSQQGKRRVTLPFDRQQLADYLQVDRSALSKELGRMKKDGLLDWHKNVFDLKADC